MSKVKYMKPKVVKTYKMMINAPWLNDPNYEPLPDVKPVERSRLRVVK